MTGKKSRSKRKAKKARLSSSFDPNGSWTGNYLSGIYEEPVQDVDDL